jgi:sulfatase modifying factor 1
MNKKVVALIIAIIIVGVISGLIYVMNKQDENGNETNNLGSTNNAELTNDLILINGGTYLMGSPETEMQRETDEVQHEVTVSDFYIGRYEVTQKEYEEVMGENPSNFEGENLPVENVTWYEAIEYCNKLSEKEGLTPVYTIDGENVSWDRSVNGYRLPTEAEWEYAARAGTTTPFNTENSISDEEANYYGHYPYGIEENYFTQENLETEPGEYRQTTVEVNSFSPNKWGLYNIHGNVAEWCFDYYGAYDLENTDNPSGSTTGTLRVNRGGGWNDYAKHLRCAYRASTTPDQKMSNIGFRVVRNGDNNSDTSVISDTNRNLQTQIGGNILIAYFSWSGNTENAAQIIQEQTGADIIELNPAEPYSSNYSEVLDQAQKDMNADARPELANHVENMEQYDTILLGYPNWWATIPMPVATFLEEYDFSGKTIIPFCSHGGGGFGQSITDISKLTPNSRIGEGLSIHYSGGTSLENDITTWLNSNGVATN